MGPSCVSHGGLFHFGGDALGQVNTSQRTPVMTDFLLLAFVFLIAGVVAVPIA